MKTGQTLLTFCASLLVCTLARGAEIEVLVRDAKGAPVPDAVVYLDTGKGATGTADAPSGPPEAKAEIAQSARQFLPYVTAVQVGTVVEFPNDDDVQHHIYSVSPTKRFEKPLYAPGSHETVLFDQPGLVTIGCNIHDWMIAYVLVLETPHFAKTNEEGRAHLTGLPAGQVRLSVWHPLLRSSASQETSLGGTPTQTEITLSLKPDRRPRRNPSASGTHY